MSEPTQTNKDVMLVDEQSKIPCRILKRQKLENGQIKYLVKWLNFSEEEATWEKEDYIKQNYFELISDFEFYVLTGERFDDGFMQFPKEKKKLIASSSSRDRTQKKSQQKKEKNLNKKTNSNIDLDEQKKSQKPKSVIADSTDQATSITLLRIQDTHQPLFKISWAPRANGQVPIDEYYTYQMLVTGCPAILLRFLERYIGKNINIKAKETQIKFICDAETDEDIFNLIQDAYHQRIIEKPQVKQRQNETSIQNTTTQEDAQKINNQIEIPQEVQEQIDPDNNIEKSALVELPSVQDKPNQEISNENAAQVEQTEKEIQTNGQIQVVAEGNREEDVQNQEKQNSSNETVNSQTDQQQVQLQEDKQVVLNEVPETQKELEIKHQDEVSSKVLNPDTIEECVKISETQA